MSKKSKYIFAAILSLLILGGCKEEMPSLGEASETVSETVTETEETAAVTAKNETETSSQTEFSETVSERENISDEQAALEKLIIDTAGNKEGYTIQSPLFGDFDGDGKNELIALYGNESTEIWFVSGDKGRCLAVDGIWRAPEIVFSCGRVFVKMEYIAYATSSYSKYFLLENSSVSEYSGVPDGQEVYPYGEFGDFTAQQGAYDFNTELDKTDPQARPITTGHTWKTHWYYIINDKPYSYSGREITKEDFLKYDGAKALLDDLARDRKTVTEIIKRGNGIININFKYNTVDTEDYFGESYGNKIMLYRGGKLFDITDDHDDCGNYVFDENVKQTYFEDFSEMIYDTAEGDENSFIRERFYGNIGGKNALYAYYGTDESFSLWYVDKDGAKKVSDDISLFIADGDVLMRNGDDYFVIKNGKSQKLDIPVAEDFSMQADGEFTGYVNAGYTDSTRDQEAKKLYWFRYRDGEIAEYTGLDITEEQLLEYGGGRAALDEIAARGGDLVNIVRRDNGIININYALHNQTVTNRFFMTLEIGADGKVTDITPKKEDGTPDNAGWYLHSLKIGG